MGSQNYIKPAISFLLYIIAQALFGQNIVIGGYAFCFVYVAFLLSLPFDLGRVPLLFIAFTLGIAIDILYNTLGLHASSCLLIAYLQEPVRQWIQPGGGYEPGMEPSIQSMGFRWVFSYCIILIFAHHLLFFSLEASNPNLWQPTLIKVLCSTAFTLSVTLVIKGLGQKRDRSRSF